MTQPSLRSSSRSSSRWSWLPLRPSLLGPCVAATGAVTAWILEWRGSDVPSWLYRVELFRSYGWMVWDSHWYGGHYLLPYSVLFPALGAAIGLYGAAALCAAAAAWAFDQLLRSEFGSRATAASVVFAIGTLVPVTIGQYGFLSGEAAGLLALLAARRQRTVIATGLAALSGLLSPAAGALLLLAFVSWTIARPRDQRVRLLAPCAAAAFPLLVLGTAFPESGRFPFWGSEFIVVMAICGVGLLLVPGHHRVLRVGLVIYSATAILVFFIGNPMGGMVGRLAEGFAPATALAIALASRRRLLGVLVLPLLIWQASPALAVVQAGAQDPSRHARYSQPLLRYLASQHTVGRLEIPFTLNHWEAAFVAPHVPLARGWERQLDMVDNPIFYADRPLTPARYHAWLTSNGVRWVALPDVALDYSSQAEARLLKSNLAYLKPVWRSQHWRVWEVRHSPGILTGPARLVSLAPDHFVLHTATVGANILRIRYTRAWTLTAGDACIRPAAHHWTEVVALDPGRIEISASIFPHKHRCTDDP